MDIDSLVRPSVLTMEAYTPILPFEVLSARLGRQPGDLVKLDANENPYGPSPRVRAALAELQFAHIYPDPESTQLRQELAAYAGVPMDMLLAGSGADELIDLVLRLLINPGDRVVDCPPTFGMYSFDTAVNGGSLLRVPRRADFALDMASLEGALDAEPRPKVVFIASPNNPDGSLISDSDLRRLLARPVIIVLDEAYVEFSGQPGHASWVLDYPNLVVLRTFSKCAGLAGLRVGYGVFSQEIMKHLWKIKQPYNISVAASAAALAALADRDYMRQSVERLVAERGRLASGLAALSYLRVYPSSANFVLCRVAGGRDARSMKLALEARGILVRYFNKPGLTDCLRISAGTPDQTDRLLQALQEL